MLETHDTINTLVLDAWSVTDNGVLSYIKTPMQQTFFTNNSDLIGKALRQAIIYFADTLEEVDQRACVLGTEFRTSRTHRYQIPSVIEDKPAEPTLMEITTYSPIAFDDMRINIGITRNDFLSSFKNGELINFANTGKSGSQMYKTRDDVYIIKTLRDHEAKMLIHSLPGFYLRYSRTSSVMTRYVGLYSVAMRSIFTPEIFCVVMLNNLPSFVNVHEMYDLKGSSVGRFASVNFSSKRLKALKDLDFEQFYPRGIRLPSEIYRRLRITLENDVFELRKMMVTDFSLMLGIHHLDDYKTNENSSNGSVHTPLKPQLGISSIFAQVSIHPTLSDADSQNSPDFMNGTIEPANPKLISKFTMKPLHIITCPQEVTFPDCAIASSLLGIPGLTHDGRRVLLYPAFIDCLQTFDNFKRMQHTLQNIRDPKRGAEYSVIHPDEYEKRLLKFLFEKVFVNSNQTLHELLASPVLREDIPPAYESQEPFELVESVNVLQNSRFSTINNTSGEYYSYGEYTIVKSLLFI